LDLHPHWLPEYLTNKIDLSPIYVHHVSEIYVRYGKSKQQIKSFKDELGDASVLPHVHISFGLSSRSFFFTIVFNLWAFLDYRNALDILREDGNSANALMQGVRELGRARYHLWGPDLNRDLSQFETPDDLRRALPLPEALVHPEDKVGMGRDWAPEDPDIDEATIVQTSINEINRLWPVFNTVALRHPR
jgi:hypothetical protein